MPVCCWLFFDQQAANKSIDMIKNEVIIEDAKTFRHKDKFHGKKGRRRNQMVGRWILSHGWRLINSSGRMRLRSGPALVTMLLILLASITSHTDCFAAIKVINKRWRTSISLARQKVSNWRHNDTAFTARFNAERQAAWSTHRDRLRSMISSGRCSGLRPGE